MSSPRSSAEMSMGTHASSASIKTLSALISSSPAVILSCWGVDMSVSRPFAHLPGPAGSPPAVTRSQERSPLTGSTRYGTGPDGIEIPAYEGNAP